jgi:hypothetical protein
LAAYIRTLLDKLADDVKLWIDRPQEISPELSSDPRVERIPPGADWERSIGHAIDEAYCVLALSKNAVDSSKSVLWREIFRGFEGKKCLTASLDPSGTFVIPQPFDPRQSYDVSRLDVPACSAAFETLIREIRQLILRHEAEAAANRRTVDVQPEQLPYLVDRQPHLTRICQSVFRAGGEPISVASHVGTAMAPPSRLLFIVPAQLADAPDMFGWRLASRDGPQYYDVGADDTPVWVRSVLSWPPAEKSTTFSEEFSATSSASIRKALREARHRQRPVCFETTVTQGQIEKDVRGWIEAWIEFWSTLTVPAAIPGDPVSAKRQPPIIALLLIVLESQRGWRRFVRPAPEAERFCRTLEELCHRLPKTPAELETRGLRPLSRLTPIGLLEAMDWCQRDLDRTNLTMAARKVVQRIFQGREDYCIPLEQFAHSITSSEEWIECVRRLQQGTAFHASHGRVP